MNTFILELAGLSAVMAVIILVLMMLKKPLGRLSAWSRYVIWAVVILRLCIPVTLGGTPSIFTFELPDTVFTQKEAAQTEAVTSVMSEPYVPVIPSITESVQQSKPIVDTAVPENTVSPVTSDEPTVVLPAVTEKSPQTQSVIPEKLPTVENKTEKPISKGIDTEELLSALFAVWAMGAAVFFAYRMTGYTAFVLSVKKSGRVKKTEGRVARIYASVGEALGIKRLPALYVAYYPISPMLCGYLKPKMIIPDLEFWDEDRIRAVLAHELIHYRRGDLYAKLLCTAAEALHWFNPAVHKAASRFNSAMELACDEIVIRKLGTAERAVYGDALLDIVRRCEGVKESPMTTALSGNAGAVKERIMNILDTGKKRRGISIIAVTLVICMIAGAVVGCAVKDSGNATETPVTENENGNGNENAEAVYYVPEYMKIVKANDTYEATLTFEGDKIIAERTKNGEEDVTYTALYDGERLTAVEVRDAAGELIRTKSLTYDEGGKVTLIAYTSADKTREYSRTEYAYGDGHLWSITYTEDDEPGDIRYSYIYEDGRVTHCYQAYGIENFLNVNIQYSYDDMGRLAVNETEYSDNGITTVIRSTNEYDADGRISRCVTVIDGSSMSEPEPYHTDTFTYDKFGNVQTLTRESGTVMDNDNVPDITKVTNTYTEDGRHLVSQSAAGNSPRPTSEVAPYKGKFDSEKLESSGFIYQGTQLKWRECDKNEYLRYRSIYETVDTLSEQAESGYLLDIDNHMWCFDDVVTDIADDAEPYVPFEGKNVEIESEARKEWHKAQLHIENGKYSKYDTLIQRIEAFLTGDYETFAQLQEAAEGALDSYEGMKLGEYTLSIEPTDEGYSIVLDVEVLESKNEILKPGDHRFVTEWHMGEPFLKYYSEAESFDMPGDYDRMIHFALKRRLYELNSELLENDSEVNTSFTGFVRGMLQDWFYDNREDSLNEYYHSSGTLKFTAEEMKEYVSRYYGFDNYEPERILGSRIKGYAYEDGYFVYVGILGGTVIPATASEVQTNDDGSVAVVVTHWADMTQTVVSKRVRYTLATAEDGTQIIKSAELLEDSGIAPAFGPST